MVDDDRHRQWLRRMMTIRQFESRAAELAERAEIFGSLHTSSGQEAVSVGACAAVTERDYMTGHHRSHAHPIAKGSALNGLMAELLGKRTGVCHGNGGSMHLADFSTGSLGESAIVGSSLAIATGAGLAASLRGEDRVCLAFFGDGASNTGIFHESLNMAGVWRLPVVFVCENNGYAVSTRHADVCGVEDIADRAASYGMPGVVVDGQSVKAVHDAVADARERALAGEGPTLVEAKTYRYHGHSYRSATLRDPEELAFWHANDPIDRWRDELIERGELTPAAFDELQVEVDADVEAAIDYARSSPDPTYANLVADMYAVTTNGLSGGTR